MANNLPLKACESCGDYFSPLNLKQRSCSKICAEKLHVKDLNNKWAVREPRKPAHKFNFKKILD